MITSNALLQRNLTVNDTQTGMLVALILGYLERHEVKEYISIQVARNDL